MGGRTPETKAVRLPALRYDVSLLFPVLFLVGVGIVMVYSASSALSLKRFGTDTYFLRKQAMFAMAGIVALVACRHIPVGFYRAMAYPILLAAAGLLLVIQVTDLGYAAGGSTRWLRLGPVNFQPSEVARVAMVVYLAYSMSKKQEVMGSFSIGFLPHVLVLGAISLLIFLQPDFGSVLILGALTWTLLFIGGARILHLGASLASLAPVVVYFMVGAEYRMKRILTFLDPWRYPADEGYQAVHSLMAFGTGGIWGTGIGKGYQKLFYLPEPHTDFIFSVVGEELGLVGVLFILTLYGLILWRGFRISARAGEPFQVYLAAGLTVALALQVCINMAVTLGLLPTKGLTLPFLSYGGTSLLINMACIGILMNIGARS